MGRWLAALHWLGVNPRPPHRASDGWYFRNLAFLWLPWGASQPSVPVGGHIAVRGLLGRGGSGKGEGVGAGVFCLLVPLRWLGACVIVVEVMIWERVVGVLGRKSEGVLCLGGGWGCGEGVVRLVRMWRGCDGCGEGMRV